MPLIPILLSDSKTQVEYKVRLARLAEESQAQIDAVQKYRAYYRGEHALLLSDDQQAFLQGVIDADGDWPVDNKCRTVVRKIKGRLNVIGWRDAQGNKVMLEEADGEPEQGSGVRGQGQGQGGAAAVGPGAQAGGGPQTDGGRRTEDGGAGGGLPGRAQGAGGGGGADGRRQTADGGSGTPGGGPAGGETLQAVTGWWVDNQMDRWEGETYKSALRDGECYTIVSHDGEKPVLSLAEMWDGDTGVYMVYEDPQTRQKPILAIKYWWSVNPTNIDPMTGTASTSTQATLQGAGYVLRATVYTRNAVYKYARFHNDRQTGFYKVAGPKTEDGFWPVQDSTDAGWPLAWVDAQGKPLGLAVVPFVTPDGSVIDPILGLNDALNKTNLDIMANADQQGFGLIAVEYETLPTVDDDNDDPSAAGDGLGLRPGRALETTGKVSKLAADDNAGLLATARHWVEGIAANSDVPFYEFLPTVGEVPSGAALQMLDSALADRAQECVVAFTPAWRAVMTLAQKLDALYGNGNGDIQRLTPLWKEPRRMDVDAEMQKVRLERAKLNLEADQQGMAVQQRVMASGADPLMMARLNAAAASNGGPGQPTAGGQMPAGRPQP